MLQNEAEVTKKYPYALQAAKPIYLLLSLLLLLLPAGKVANKPHEALQALEVLSLLLLLLPCTLITTCGYVSQQVL